MHYINDGIDRVIDIPFGWWATPQEFKAKVIELIESIPLWSRAPEYGISHPDGSVTPFYPVLCAISPEWWIISREEMQNLLYPKLVEEAHRTYLSATAGYAKCLLGMEYLAWGLEQWIFSQEQIKKIQFGGDTSESYIRDYGNPELMEDLIEKLIHPHSRVTDILEKVWGDVEHYYNFC